MTFLPGVITVRFSRGSVQSVPIRGFRSIVGHYRVLEVPETLRLLGADPSAQTSDRDIGDIIARLKTEGLYVKPDEELFDLRKDPSEVHNLADNPDYAQTLQEFRSQLAKWRTAVGDVDLTPEFRTTGWPGTYPTRPLAEWLSIEAMWEKYILQGGEKPQIARPPQFAPETKYPKTD